MQPLRKANPTGELSKKGHFFGAWLRFLTIRKIVFFCGILLVIGAGFIGYNSYSQIEQSLKETRQTLQEIQSALSLFRTSTDKALSEKQHIIEEQDKELKDKGVALEEAEQDKAFLQGAIRDIQQRVEDIEKKQVSNSVSFKDASRVLKEFTSSIVSVYCASDSSLQQFQQGSGVLYRTPDSTSNLYPYYVQTNLHVTKTKDDSPSKCVIVLYPNAEDSNSYLLFKSQGYRSYKANLDVAFLKPQIIAKEPKAGSLGDLESFSKNEETTSICNKVELGDGLSILGYPGVGGDTLTVTEGIVSGFEFRHGIRYIKTSAKIEEGSSGGIALKDSGCVIGIPTFVATGRIESIGRILDASYLTDIGEL